LRVRVTNREEDAPFGYLLPPDGGTGTIVRQLGVEKLGDEWYVVDLDEPFTYDGTTRGSILIRSREKAQRIGDPEPTGVFVFLVPDPSVLDAPSLRGSDCDHGVCGVAHTLAVAETRTKASSEIRS
jgi:hypothetical protein